MHVALGGCLKAPPVSYGLTEDTGGHIAYVLAAARAQAARGAEVAVVTRRFADHGHAYTAQDEPFVPGARILRLDDGDPRYLAKEALEQRLPMLAGAFEAMLDREGAPDVIHAHFADAAAVVRKAAAARGIPVIYTAHSLGIDKREAIGEAGPVLERRIAQEDAAMASAAAIVASSRDECERQLMLYPSAREGIIHRVVPGIAPVADADPGRAAALVAPFLRDPSRPPVLAIARPVAKKNLPALVEMFATDERLRKGANLVIVAGLRDGLDTGPEEQVDVYRALLAAVDRHDLWGRVALPKRHEPADVPALYAWAAERRGVFANPALTEPFGLTLLEAAAAGLPVVATDRGGPRDIIGALGHGTCHDPEDVAGFAARIAGLLDDPASWDAAAAAARHNRIRWSWDRYAADHAALCEGLLTPHAVPARPRHLLVSDVDGTLTGDRAAAARFAGWRAGNGDWGFAVATGRSLTESRAVLRRWALPEPDAFITAVGSEIHLRAEDGRLIPDEAFARHLDDGWDRSSLLAALGGVPGLTPQDPVEQRARKLSWFGDAAAARAARTALDDAGLRARIVHSHGNLIDVLPPNGGKARAMRWLGRRLGVPQRAILAAGDSGNDADMLSAAHRAVIVGNASEELAHLAPRRGLHRAQAYHADGVLEGIDALSRGLPVPSIRAGTAANTPSGATVVRDDGARIAAR
ncbi:HAD-IIB family hydrolase [Hasllibacter halocynthiae]|nr:HAD-IIB family hydrolase [Hasllibacter halocynthiae]